MIARIVGELGPWNWVAIGLVLLVMEIALPGVFLLWFGMAAIVVGALSIMFHNAAFWPVGSADRHLPDPVAGDGLFRQAPDGQGGCHG